MVHVNIRNVTLYNNTGIAWSDFVMTIDEWSCNYTMVHAEKIKISNGLRYTRLLGSSGLSVYGISQNSISLNQENHKLQFEYTVHIVESYVTNIGNTAVYVGNQFQESSNLRVKFTNLSISCSNDREHANTGLLIISMVSMVLERVNFSYSMFSSVNVHVKYSKITIHSASILENEGFGGVVLWKSNVTFLGDTFLTQNYGHRKGAVYVHSSTLIFQGNVWFMNNTGYDGGALALYEGSDIVIGKQAHLKFIDNHAKHFGGALYVDNPVFKYYATITCFYKLADTFNSGMKHCIVFENNTADYAGSALYGGWIDFCETDTPERSIKLDFDILSQLHKKHFDLSPVASTLSVCVCAITQGLNAVSSGTTLWHTLVQQFKYLQ